MDFTNNISTNIIRDQSKNINFIPTPNAKEIFDRIFLHNYGSNRSFNLIGNYGTGKSTFLWALEKNLNREEYFFSSIDDSDGIKEYEFIKIIGENTSLSEVLARYLNLKKTDSTAIISALEKKRKTAEKNHKGLVLLIDEFGKLLEYSARQKSKDDIYLLQLISEWVNNDETNTYFILTLHQNFSSYGKNLTSQDKLEWEKVKGRFVDLVFNEPVEQLIYFASKTLDNYKRPQRLDKKHQTITDFIKVSKLVNLKASIDSNLAKSIFPLDWLSANVLVKSMQRYGQNERSLFSFLGDTTKHSVKNFSKDFYTISNVYDYLVHSLPTEINSPENPHRAQWLTTFRMLEKAELIFNDNYDIAAEVIKTISLVNLFSKIGGLFDKRFIIKYFKLTRNISVEEILNTLEKSGIIRFYKHSNKINFLEGTDIDLEQELIVVNKEINANFSLSAEILNKIEFPVLLAKKYSFITGTNRFFEIRIIDSLENLTNSRGPIDGYINLIFDEIKQSKVIQKSKIFDDNLFVLYKNAVEIRKEVLMILKFERLLEKHASDKNALKLINEEKEYHINLLTSLVLKKLFGINKNIWIYDGKVESIQSKHGLYSKLSDICFKVYSKTPVFINELINKEFLSSPIKTARKALIRRLLEQESVDDIGFDKDKFPPEKSIFRSLLRDSGIHQTNKDIGYFKLDNPGEVSNLSVLWKKSEAFFNSAISNKRNLAEFYDELSQKPYKLKKGFIDYWVPIFLMAKKEDHALFHIDGGFIPYLSEDTIDLIHKKPQNFLIKCYNVSGLRVNLLESYKELVQIGDSNVEGTQSTFLSIFGNFLRFQRGLNNYTLKTSKLSSKAIKLREAIISSRDPEDALFNVFPSSLGFHSIAIKDDEEVLNSFTNHIQEAIREIRSAFDELLTRIEKVILDSFYCSSSEFEVYKSEIQAKISEINPSALSDKQSVYFKRLVSPLDDRISWIKSVADVVLGKGIENLLDQEELLLIEGIKDLSLGLIKASEIRNFNNSSEHGKLYSIRFFGETGEFVDNKLVVNANTSKEFEAVKKKISISMDALDEGERKELLVELLSKEMNI